LKNIHRYAVVLSGGSGSRLWPLSRRLHPKQFLRLNGEETLLQQTIRRVAKNVKKNNVHIVTNQDYKFETKGQLLELYPEICQNILLEPLSRNTLPAIFLASIKIFKQDAEAIIAVFPSDHVIENQDAFIDAWNEAEKAANEGYIVLMGVKPNFPSTSYGYIKPKDKLKISGSTKIFSVEHFYEKPSLDNANQYLLNNYFWNSGIFIFKAKTLIDLVSEYEPEIYSKLKDSDENVLNEVYVSLPSISIDYGIIEKSNAVAFIPVDMTWSDLGTWDSIYLNSPKDNNGNLNHGNVINQDTTNSLIWSENALIATVGLDNIAIIQTTDAILVCDKKLTENLKSIVSIVESFKPSLIENHRTVYRPWGFYTILEDNKNYKIKRIHVNPMAKLSLQSHKHRSEHWIVVSGIAKITNNDEIYLLNENQSTYIPSGNIHRLENNTNLPLVIIEVQSGSYVDEDDIVRFEDFYGRE
jgi:mannose-1-phosphate guanylyltransferase/mannose-6-phosphate isomerase